MFKYEFIALNIGLHFQGNIEYYADEVEINAKFRTFTKNCSLVFAGHNTVTAQLKVKSKRGRFIYEIYGSVIRYKMISISS